ncbi:hypothetical protein SPAB_02118 [Salmonella enterica subsp. enterica serovar Paratyphi B str. SPB7]|uniref:Uncharacterized protein n=1 Tax=Salmonella paratyphi B (strain ATCC BAA-1250 / SPB7) TaxID=1016998 RepID=A0A6C6Z1K1_SALPB|nr:hypothetical protein SPAB_02118 [Salmonella enterica subsp. enterica serovar Paratyphi B str. SPB7]
MNDHRPTAPGSCIRSGAVKSPGHKRNHWFLLLIVSFTLTCIMLAHLM